MKPRMQFNAMALEIPDFPEHPNRVPFSGVLTELDVPSDDPPKGAMGHRIVMPSDVAERALPSLLGMAVNFAADAESHDVRRKVGIITGAEIVAGELRVAGYLFGKDFPDVVREVRARRSEMGMSYEITGVEIEDDEAEVWVLSKLVFTGAAILEKDAAAYKRTSLAATAGQGGAMDEKLVEQKVESGIRNFFARLFGEKEKPAAAFTEADVKRIAAEAAAAVKNELGAQITALTEENKQLRAGQSTATVEARRAKWVVVRDAALAAGKLVPALVPGLNAQAELAIASTTKVKVSQIQADKSTKEVEADPLDVLCETVKAMAQIVPTAELAGAAAQGAGNVIPFTPAKGVELDQESVVINARAEQIAAELRKQDPKLTELQAFKEALPRARREMAAGKAGGTAAGKA